MRHDQIRCPKWEAGEPLTLIRAERRAWARGQVRQTNGPIKPFGQGKRLCLYCAARLTNGAPVCSDECDDGWWRITPTVDGELWHTRAGDPSNLD
jgi:hypothetical protein